MEPLLEPLVLALLPYLPLLFTATVALFTFLHDQEVTQMVDEGVTALDEQQRKLNFSLAGLRDVAMKYEVEWRQLKIKRLEKEMARMRAGSREAPAATHREDETRNPSPGNSAQAVQPTGQRSQESAAMPTIRLLGEANEPIVLHYHHPTIGTIVYGAKENSHVTGHIVGHSTEPYSRQTWGGVRSPLGCGRSVSPILSLGSVARTPSEHQAYTDSVNAGKFWDLCHLHYNDHDTNSEDMLDGVKELELDEWAIAFLKDVRKILRRGSVKKPVGADIAGVDEVPAFGRDVRNVFVKRREWQRAYDHFEKEYLEDMRRVWQDDAPGLWRPRGPVQTGVERGKSEQGKRMDKGKAPVRVEEVGKTSMELDGHDGRLTSSANGDIHADIPNSQIPSSWPSKPTETHTGRWQDMIKKGDEVWPCFGDRSNNSQNKGKERAWYKERKQQAKPAPEGYGYAPPHPSPQNRHKHYSWANGQHHLSQRLPVSPPRALTGPPVYGAASWTGGARAYGQHIQPAYNGDSLDAARGHRQQRPIVAPPKVVAAGERTQLKEQRRVFSPGSPYISNLPIVPQPGTYGSADRRDFRQYGAERSTRPGRYGPDAKVYREAVQPRFRVREEYLGLEEYDGPFAIDASGEPGPGVQGQHAGCKSPQRNAGGGKIPRRGRGYGDGRL